MGSPFFNPVTGPLLSSSQVCPRACVTFFSFGSGAVHWLAIIPLLLFTGCKELPVRSNSSNASTPASPSQQSLQELSSVSRARARELDLPLGPQESILVPSLSGISSL